MTVKEKLLQIVLNAKGDDLERCERSYRGLSPEMMDGGHGESGFSRQEVLNRYKMERAEWEEVYKFVQGVTK